MTTQRFRCPNCDNPIKCEPATDGPPFCRKCGWDEETAWNDAALHLRAITLHRPWSSLIANGFKIIETRLHDKFKGLEGERIAIHAGTIYDTFALREIKRWTRDPVALSLARPENCYLIPMRAIVCIAKVVKVGWLDETNSVDALIDCGKTKRFGLWLDELEIPERPCEVKGRQGIWKVAIHMDACEAKRA